MSSDSRSKMTAVLYGIAAAALLVLAPVSFDATGMVFPSIFMLVGSLMCMMSAWDKLKDSRKSTEEVTQ